MVTLEQIETIDPQVADWIAALRASIDEYATAGKRQASVGMRGVFNDKLGQATGKSGDEAEQDRHIFIETIFSVEGGSSKGLNHAQCHGTAVWLDEGGAALVPRIVTVALQAQGQTMLPGLDDPVVQAAVELGAEVTEGSENMKEAHWVDELGAEQRFWEFVVDGIGLKAGDVYQALGVSRLAETDKSKREVLSLLRGLVDADRAKLVESLDPPEVLHREARAVAWADVYAPDGTMVNLTAREGQSPDAVASTALAWWEAWEMLKRLGWSSVLARQRREAKPRAQRQAPQPAPAPVPGKANGGNGAQQLQSEPAASSNDGDGQGNDGRLYLDTDVIKVGVTKSEEPCVQFWLTSKPRQYPEIVWYLGADSLLEMAPWLGERGITKEKLETVSTKGKCIEIPCRVHYVLSDKTNAKGRPYKDIVAVEPR